MKSAVYNLIDFDKPVFRAYALWTAILLLKMMYLSLHTAFYRFKNQAFANIEDVANARKVRFNDDQVERVRRAHRNDMENILPSVIIGFLYALTNPAPAVATLLFKLNFLARLAHTFVYAVMPMPQPCRVIAFAVNYLVTIYWAVSVIGYLW